MRDLGLGWKTIRAASPAADVASSQACTVGGLTPASRAVAAGRAVMACWRQGQRHRGGTRRGRPGQDLSAQEAAAIIDESVDAGVAGTGLPGGGHRAGPCAPCPPSSRTTRAPRRWIAWIELAALVAGRRVRAALGEMALAADRGSAQEGNDYRAAPGRRGGGSRTASARLWPRDWRCRQVVPPGHAGPSARGSWPQLRTSPDERVWSA